MIATAKTSYQVIISVLCGLMSAASGLFAIVTQTDLFLPAVLVFWGLGIVFGIRGRRSVRRSPDQLSGAGLAAWGMAIPVVGVVLGFFLLPAT